MATSKSKKIRWQVLPLAHISFKLLVQLKPKDIAMFRFLLEGYDNLANFTVLERSTALLKVSASPHAKEQLKQTLAEINEVIPLNLSSWPHKTLN